jgi:C-terminal processing protease CtpA/Prc
MGIRKTSGQRGVQTMKRLMFGVLAATTFAATLALAQGKTPDGRPINPAGIQGKTPDGRPINPEGIQQGKTPDGRPIDPAGIQGKTPDGRPIDPEGMKGKTKG